ncbi:MAG: alpha/beta hydrolase [Bacteroidales bacterium]|nr:alpha/beta hydrolase [Bacteroidales bacterium]
MKTEKITFTFPDDYEGKVIATLIKTKGAESSEKAILYLHGFADYFFQEHLAAASHLEEIRFYALELRKCGRSRLPHQKFNYCKNLNEYFPEISQSLRQMEQDGIRDITLMGHSTGGLIAVIYTAEGEKKNAIARLVLNSPFFEFNLDPVSLHLGIPFLSMIGKILPDVFVRLPAFPLYTQSLHRSARGEWHFNKEWKPMGKIPMFFAWIRAIRSGQKKIHKGLHLPQPVLCLSSDASLRSTRWIKDASRKDTILNVEHIEKYAPCLGDHVTCQKIEGALHDVILSRKSVREKALRIIFDWMHATE